MSAYTQCSIEILIHDYASWYATYRNDRISWTADGVILAIKSNSLISPREIDNLKTNIDVISTEIHFNEQ